MFLPQNLLVLSNFEVGISFDLGQAVITAYLGTFVGLKIIADLFTFIELEISHVACIS